MGDERVVYVLGSGAVGMALAACLVKDGRRPITVRTRNDEALRETITVTLHYGADRVEVPVETIGLSKLTRLDGIIVVTAKSYANGAIALALKKKVISRPTRNHAEWCRCRKAVPQSAVA
jgi:2-dehydropantoate 2-reductase